MNAQFRSLCTADVAPAAAHDAVLHPVHTLDHGIVRHTANEHVKFKVTVAVLLNIGCSGMDHPLIQNVHLLELFLSGELPALPQGPQTDGEIP